MADVLKPQISVKIQKSGGNDGFSITGHLEERFTYGISADYQQPFAQQLQNLANGFWVTSLYAKTHPIIAPQLTANYWQGSNTQDMQITLVLEAQSDPLTEIRTPILNLLSLVAPSYNGLLLDAPIKNSVLSEEQVKKITEEVAKASVSVSSSLLSLASTALETKLSDLTNGITDKALGAIDAVKGAVSNIANAVSGGIGQIAQSATQAVSPVMSAVSSGASKVVGAAGGAVGSLTDSLSNFTSSATAGLNSMASGVSGGIAGLTDSASGLVGSIVGSSNSLTTKAAEANAAAALNSKAALPESPTAKMMANIKSPIVSIQIGEYMLFPCVVITNVTTNILNQIDAYSGWPLSAEVQISFRPMFTQAFGDVVAVFLDKRSPVSTEEDVSGSLDPTETLASSITSVVTKPLQSVGNAITSSVSNVANAASNKIVAMTSGAVFKGAEAVGKMLPWGDDTEQADE